LCAGRAAIGPAVDLMVDANQSMPYPEAKRRPRFYEPFDLFWLEEPLPAGGIAGRARLAASTTLPIAVSESIYALGHFREYLTDATAGIVRVDAAPIGGVTPWLKTAHLVEAFNVEVAPHFLMELHMSLAAAILNALYAASHMTPADLVPAQFVGARLLLISGITLALSPTCAATVGRAVELAHAEGLLVCVDPNVRPQLWSDPNECRAAMRALIAGADLAFLGDEDAAYLFPGLDEEAVLSAVRALGPRTVVLKLGARGARAVRDGEEARVAPHPVAVVDTVGAGDGFNAGFVAGLLRDEALPRCLALGARVGAAAVAVAGDWEGYPTAGELGLNI